METRILLVEDDQDIRETLQEVLLAEGYVVEIACNGQEALDCLRAATTLPNLVLLDLTMPVKDGLEFREEQQRDPILAGVPVVIMSAASQIEEKRLHMNVHAAIKKPFDIDVMLRTVALHVR